MVDVPLTSYIEKSLKKAQPGLRLSAELAEKLNKRINRLARALVRGAAKSAVAAKRKTVLHKDVESALFTVSTDEALCGKLVHQGAKATASLESSTTSGKVAKGKRAGLLFSVSRMTSILRKGVETDKLRVSEGSAVYLAAILEGLVREVFTAAGEICSQQKRKVLTVKDFDKAVEGSKSLAAVF